MGPRMFVKIGAFLIMVMGSFAVSHEDTPSSVPISPDQLAAHYAGIRQGGAFSDLENRIEYQEFAQELHTRWIAVQQKRGKELSDFQAQFIPSSNRTLFYPMAGPDVFHALSFFPDSKTYILVGLERIGRLFSHDELKDFQTHNRVMHNIQDGTSSLFARSFFITMDMSKDYYFGGVTPTLLALIKRMGGRIESVRGVGLSDVGTLIIPQTPDDVQGVEIVFRRSPKTDVQTLYYFRQNLDNGHIKKSFLTFVAAQKPLRTFFKSASYTPHQKPFSQLVSFVLDKSGLILQDDSGIRFRAFQESSWAVSLFGDYNGPYGESFVPYDQPDLKKAFQERTTVPLPFRIGYGYGKAQSNLLIARWR